MKWTRGLLGLVALVMMGFAACNYTVGDCWPVGQGAGAGDVGSGAVVSVGASGDQPVGTAQGALSEAQCNEPPDNACPQGGCTPDETCLDMYDKCRAKGQPCTRNINGMSLCAYCQDDCLHDKPYKFRNCYDCGFR
jgi:hypothetical protein